jgi:polyisoprenoid-binding protein YceI
MLSSSRIFTTFALLSLVLTPVPSAALVVPANEAKRVEVDAYLYKVSQSREVTMTLNGTTPIKNWKMSATGIVGEAVMAIAEGSELLEIRSLQFSLPVANLKGEVKAMDEDAYEALKADRHKDISFKLISADVSSRGGISRVAARGSLTVAGVTREVTLMMQGALKCDGTIAFTGSQLVKMSDYNVEPPSILFGAIKARDEMTLTYKLIFAKSQPRV